ncbi:MAG: SRPBCC domain-containing protein [Fimbriimonas sp.]|nr:SRPBCC domain-containing protein [Fimbriimonas sp.]
MTSTIDATREIVSIRTYAASKDLLLRMWSNPEHVTHWWGPVGFTTTTHEMQFRTGGTWRFTMHGPDGRDYPNVVRYRHISSDRIEYAHGGDGVPVDFTVCVTFAERGEGTEMTFRMTFPSADERDRVVRDFGADKGLEMTTDRLGEYVSTQDPKAIELVIVRKFAAPQDTVWRAITEPEQIDQWMCPAGLTMEHAAGDFRVGGSWSAKMIAPNGFSFESVGEYLEISPTHRLVFSHRWKKDDGTFKPTTTVSMSLAEHDRATTLTFVQSGFWSEEARAAHLGGWSNPIHKLGILVGATKADRTLSLTREFDAPLELVWKSWTEADRVAAWFAPRPYTVPECRIDLRPGGEFFLVMRSPEGMDHPMISEITDVEPMASLGWVNSVPGPDGSPAIVGGTMIFFEDLGGSTRVTVHSYASAMSDIGAMMIGGMEMGWNMTLDQMVEVTLAATA